jgi:UDP-N-acetylmuramate dehydrogenase
VQTIRQSARKIKSSVPIRFDEPMAPHTSFRIGGPADAFLSPRTERDLREARRACLLAGVPVFLLGGGTNILVADAGIRGAVIDLTGLRGIRMEEGVLHALAGTPISDAAAAAAASGFSGLEFAYSLPGTVGGAVWMNARCYDGAISDRLLAAVSLGDDPEPLRREVRPEDWGYKRSPYQGLREAILSAEFRLEPGDRGRMEARMAEIKADRERKGHFRFPSAGSMFKNDRAFGAPTGALIDSLGLRGLAVGGAQVAPYHGNIFINTGRATAAEMRELILTVERRVADRLGFRLEREVILVGDWEP